jgi:hypothetical protein
MITYISYFIKTLSSSFFSTSEICLGFIHGIVCRLSAYETQLRNEPIMKQTRSIQQDTKMFISMPTEVMNSVQILSLFAFILIKSQYQFPWKYRLLSSVFFQSKMIGLYQEV